VLILTDQVICSNMTYNGTKVGLVPWKEIILIREVKTFWFIRSIEVYTQTGKNKASLNLANDEAAMEHAELFKLLTDFWQRYR
jgi:hypothetical protein